MVGLKQNLAVQRFGTKDNTVTQKFYKFNHSSGI